MKYLLIASVNLPHDTSKDCMPEFDPGMLEPITHACGLNGDEDCNVVIAVQQDSNGQVDPTHLCNALQYLFNPPLLFEILDASFSALRSSVNPEDDPNGNYHTLSEILETCRRLHYRYLALQPLIESMAGVSHNTDCDSESESDSEVG